MPELLSPAGNWDCLRAAVTNGADAIYFGTECFNARLRAQNFKRAELPAIAQYLHERGKRGFLTLNTLIFAGELEEAVAELRMAAQAGIDAVIVQDLGLARLAQEVAPELEVHASTQMTITSPEGLAFARRLGIKRAVLARELSLPELGRLAKENFPLEVFVHGALCVAYSGQCLTSEALGQRSANRGECAQACRMPYTLLVDGLEQDLGERKYLLSPQDLAGLEAIPELVRMGIASLKIEGRLKSPEYVAAVTRVYRAAIDRAKLADPAAVPAGCSNESWYEFEMVFSRGLFSGWLGGVNHQALVDGRFGKKRGVFLGRLAAVGPDWIELSPRAPVAPGDGLVFGNGEDTEREEGGRVFAATGSRFYFGNGQIAFHRLHIGQPVWKTDDPKLNQRLRQSFAKDLPRQRTPLRMRVEGASGAPLVLHASAAGVEVEVQSSQMLSPARNAALTAESVRRHFARLQETPFELHELVWEVQGDTFLPAAALNALRRKGVAMLEECLSTRAANTIGEIKSTPLLSDLLRPAPPVVLQPVQGIVLCRTFAQLGVALECGFKTVYVDFEDVRQYRRAVQLAEGRAQLFLATPRIHKPGEDGFLRLIANAAPCGVLVRNLGAIEFFRGRDLCLHGDFSLNVANPLTAGFLLSLGLSQLTVSYDLNLPQILALLSFCPSACYELTIHQHMPMFHMEHCVFAAFLSSGTDHTNCGRPCDRHKVRLRDRVGAEHVVQADVGCRNTVFNARAQSGVQYFERLVAHGIQRFRIELLDESAEAAENLLKAYSALFAGNISGEKLWRELRVESQLGVTKGSWQ